MENVVDKWKLNKSVLASKMNMTNTTFNKKLKNESFSDSEIILLKMILKELRDDLTDIVEIDINDALKLMMKNSKTIGL